MGLDDALRALGLGLDASPAPIAVPAEHGLFTGREAPDTEGTQSFAVANGTQLDVRTSFVVGSCIVDNNTSAWLNVPDATKDGTGRFVPPGFGAAIPILGHISRARINWLAPPGKTQPAAVAGEVAQVVFASSPVPLGFGVATPTSAVGRAVAFPLLSRGVGTYTFIPPNLQGIKGMIAYVQTTAGGGSATLSISNSDQTFGFGKTDSILTSVQVSGTNGANIYVYPGITVTANLSASFVLGQTPVIAVVVGTAAVTFQVDYDLVP